MMHEGLPISTRLLQRAHELLMGEAGRVAASGEFRKQSVRVGDLVPAPAPEIASLMVSLEQYINELSDMPALLRAGLVHVQFETIHPFLDGNGRIGRLLIVLILIDSGLLTKPILYPSYYFKKHAHEYYYHLSRVRTHGDFEGWIGYYLKAIRDTGIDAYKRAQDIETLETNLKQRINTDSVFTRTKETAHAALDLFFIRPITTTTIMSEKLGKAYNTIQALMITFMDLGVVSEHMINKRSKAYRFDSYIELLEKEYV